jgi:hypothetical protein
MMGGFDGLPVACSTGQADSNGNQFSLASPN